MPVTSKNTRFGVVGAGAWGTALAILLSRNGYPVEIWGRNRQVLTEMARRRVHPNRLVGIEIPSQIQCKTDLADLLQSCEEVLLAVPSLAMANVVDDIARIKPCSRLVWAAKGLNPANGELLSQLVQAKLPEADLAVLSGPTFANEVAHALPTAVVIASENAQYAEFLANAFQSQSFRVYTSADLVGVQIGGAAKNVLAIAAGLADGMGFGANARAALITRGLAELARLGQVMGGKAETFMGLAGLGDLALTCTDDQSRNRRFGVCLAKGGSVEGVLAEIGESVEGVQTARHLTDLAERYAIEMPICDQVRRVLYEGLDPRKAVQNLLARERKGEF